MILAALKGLAGRKLRSVLTAVAIVLGVAMVSGSFVLTDTISKAFDSIFTSAYRSTDAVISGKSVVSDSTSGNATVSPQLLARVRNLSGVAAATGSIMDIGGSSTQAKLIDAKGKTLGSGGAPTFGFGIDAGQPRFNPMHLVAGRWPSGPHSIVIDAQTAKNHGYAVGDSIGASANGPVRRFTIAGIATYANVNSLGGATFALFDIPTARRMLGIHGFTAISVAKRQGVSEARILEELRSVAPATTQVRSGAAQARQDKKAIGSFVSFIRGFLLGFGGIALFVGAFVIFNTLSITVRQRTRELATLRTLGASRRQVLRSVLLESAAIGLVSSVVGLVLGFGLAQGLSAVFKALGVSLPQASTVYATHTFVVSLLVGVVVTVLSGLGPALRATRVPPISAVREGATPEGKRRLGPVAGVAIGGLGFALLGYAVLGGHLGSGRSLLALAAGALALLVGVAALAPALVTGLARLVSAPFRATGGAAGRLASENATRNPSRTAATAAALMIGLALVSFVAVLGKGVHDSFENAVRDQFAADYVVTSANGWDAFPVGAGNAIANTPGIAAATSIRSDGGLVGKTKVGVNAVDPATLDGLYRFDWKQGSDATLSRLGAHGAIVKQAFARKRHLRVGGSFTLRTPQLRPLRLTVEGIYQPPRVGEVLGSVVISQRAFDGTFPRPQNRFTLVRGGSLAALKSAVAAFPNAKVETRDGFVKSQSSFVGTLLNMLYVLLALSVVVSLFGMINTLVLSVFERTREIGMLRAVGMTRRQVRRMVRAESVMTALIGAALGLPLGIFLAAAVTHALGKYGVSFALPIPSLAAFTVVAIVAGVLAAIAPARRAAKLNVLQALAYE